MENFVNVFARVLDRMGNEVKEIVLLNGKKIPLTFMNGHYVISAETAWINDVAKLPYYSLRCTGLSFNNKTRKKELCNAELTPYCLNGRYYFRSFQNSNDNWNLHTPHLPFCPFASDSRKKSTEWTTSYKTEPDAMKKSLMECLTLLEKNNTAHTKDSSVKKIVVSNDKEKKTNDEEQNDFIDKETKARYVNPKSSKDFWFAAMTSSDMPRSLRESIMTPHNYKDFRSESCTLKGIKTLMAKRCNYKLIQKEIKKQLPDVAQLFDNSSGVSKTKASATPVILEDPFCGEDPVIIVLIDRLPQRETWKKLTRRSIKQKTLMSFVLGEYKEKESSEEENLQREYPSDYFSVMSNWKEYSLTVDGKPRKLVVGDIIVLGRQIDYFLEQDLEDFEDIL